ncbi:MAG: MXAN_6521/LA_1396 family lipoprotein [Myxococcota bacterium]
MRRFLLFLFLLAGCATVKMHRVRADYDTVDKHRTKRLVVITQPLPDGSQKAGELFSLVARRYVNQKRDFLVKEHRAQAEAASPTSLCAEGLEGVLWLAPTVTRKEAGFEAALFGRLLRCTDGEEVWAAEAGGSFPTRDEALEEVTAQYEQELGAEVGPYVPVAFHLLRPTLDTLPKPQLTSEEQDEKIELGE